MTRDRNPSNVSHIGSALLTHSEIAVLGVKNTRSLKLLYMAHPTELLPAHGSSNSRACLHHKSGTQIQATSPALVLCLADSMKIRPIKKGISKIWVCGLECCLPYPVQAFTSFNRRENEDIHLGRVKREFMGELHECISIVQSRVPIWWL